MAQAPRVVDYGYSGGSPVTEITRRCDAKHNALPALSACCRPVFAWFASARRTNYTRNFAARFAATPLRLPPQEPFGDSRPQAFFFG